MAEEMEAAAEIRAATEAEAEAAVEAAAGTRRRCSSLSHSDSAWFSPTFGEFRDEMQPSRWTPNLR
jgi:hypothetical protein